MLAEDARDDRIRALEEQATFVQALAATLGAKDGPKQVQDAYRAAVRQLRGETTATTPAPPVAAIMADPYLAALGGRIARQARRRKRAEAAAKAEAMPDGR